MIPFVDKGLNHVTMYRLVLWYVALLLAAAFGLGFVGLVPVDPTALAFSVVLILGTGWLVNRGLAMALNVPTNPDSVVITGLILALILPPVTAADPVGVGGLVLASAVAVGSKFLLAVGRKHVFNPVAIGVTASMLLMDQPATWWVGGNLALMPLVVIGGLLVVRKVHRFDLLGVYILANLAVTLATTGPAMMGEALTQTLVSSPLLFAGFAMLTEPLTAPDVRWARLAFGAIVGGLSSPGVHVGGFYLTPELAFLAGNVFAFVVGPKRRMKLTLLGIERTAAGCFDFVFKPDRPLAFEAGQYLDWTLAVPRPDDRGNRRSFTIASAPTEGDLRLGVKFHSRPSAFKRTLAAMKPGDVIYASHLAGNFTLPPDPDEKLAFIAGGIGVTPFRSMVQELLHRQERRSVIMLYGNNAEDEIAYGEVFRKAEDELGLKTVYAVANGKPAAADVHHGFIDEAMIKREIPDFLDRTFYLSGPHAMVVRFRRALGELGVPRRRIKVDHFPGFA